MALDQTAEPSGLAGVQTQAEAAIRSANERLLAQTADRLKLPIAVVVEQRDTALSENEALRLHASQERAAMMAEQDQFITFLMTDHEVKLLKLSDELKSARATLERQRALGGSSGDGPGQDPDPSESALELGRLKDMLEAAYAEADETRADAARLQGDLDDAVRSMDDVRLALRQEVDTARDEAFAIQSQLDEANRLLEDARDQARDEAFRYTEELDELRRDRDERLAEVRRLRERLAQLTDAPRPSMPPPPAVTAELDVARTDNQLLRKQLIDAKRELSRMARELELSQVKRIPRPTPVPGRSSSSSSQRPVVERKPTPSGTP